MRTFFIILSAIILLSCSKQQEPELNTYIGNINTEKITTTNIHPKKVDGNIKITINAQTKEVSVFLEAIEEVSHNLEIHTSLDLNVFTFLNNLESVGDTLFIDLKDSPTISLDFLRKLKDVKTIKIINGRDLNDYCTLHYLLQELPEDDIILINNKYSPTYEQIINGRCSTNIPPLPPSNLNGSIPVFDKVNPYF